MVGFRFQTFDTKTKLGAKSFIDSKAYNETMAADGTISYLRLHTTINTPQFNAYEINTIHPLPLKELIEYNPKRNRVNSQSLQRRLSHSKKH